MVISPKKGYRRDYVPVPVDYLKEMGPLTDEEFGKLIRGLLAYAIYGDDVPSDGNLKFYDAYVMHEHDKYIRHGVRNA